MKRFCIMLLLISILFCFTACTPSEKQIDWSLNGTWIQNGQATQNTVAFTITGAIPIKADPGGPAQSLSLSTSWPEGFTYANQNETPFSCNAFPSKDTEASAIFVMFGSAYNKETKLPTPMVIYLCPEKEYVVVQWRDNTDLYLAASTDANADTDAILAHFHGLIITDQ